VEAEEGTLAHPPSPAAPQPLRCCEAAASGAWEQSWADRRTDRQTALLCSSPGQDYGADPSPLSAKLSNNVKLP